MNSLAVSSTAVGTSNLSIKARSLQRMDGRPLRLGAEGFRSGSCQCLTRTGHLPKPKACRGLERGVHPLEAEWGSLSRNLVVSAGWLPFAVFLMVQYFPWL